FFFFSSRRRHTRFSRDWSSDVCSSDLHAKHFDRYVRKCEISYFVDKNHVNKGYATRAIKEIINYIFSRTDMEKIYCRIDPENLRSEERRVGKECRSRWLRDQ